jgi:sn-glycerol 3-phosphate transport system ATP-binding protein
LIGSPLDVYERPATRFVAGFIGSPTMNFLTARLRSDGTSIEIPGGIHIPVDSGGLPDYGSKQVTFGIRPEHFELTEPKESAMLLRVNHVELLGADTLVHGHLGDEKTLLTARLPDIYHFKKGSTLSLTVSPQKMHLFDKNTGKRIEA